MSANFKPNLSTLQSAQRRLWDELVEVPEGFVLCGGTAVGLHLGHRISVDFDFFSTDEFDPDTLYDTVRFFSQSKVIQKAANTLTCLVDRNGLVQVSFFCVPKIKWIEQPRVADDNGIRVASLIDLAGMKAAVVQKRAEAKDYIDMDAMLNCGVVDLPTALAAARAIYGESFNPMLTLKALSYYEDGNLHALPQQVRDRLAAAVKAVDLSHLPDLNE